MFVTSAYAQTAAAATSPIIADVLQFAPLVLMGLVFYFLFFLPQQQEAKKKKARLAALKRGDKVVTAGGILGTVKKATDGAENVDIEITPNVVVTVVRSTITSVVVPEAANDKV